MSDFPPYSPDPRGQQWQPSPGAYRGPSPQPVAPLAPRTNVVAIVGVVFGSLGVLLAFGLGIRYIPAMFGVVALVLGLIGDVLSRRGYAGKRMGVLAAALGIFTLLPAFA